MNKKILGLALTAIFTTGTAQAILIDDFNGPTSFFIDANITTPSLGNTDTHATAFGGQRTVDLTVDVDQFGGGFAEDDISLDGATFGHSTDSGVDATTLITWENTPSDLIDGLTNNIFRLDVFSIDQGSADFLVSVTDSFNTTEDFGFSGSAVGVYGFTFSNFATIDFLTIKKITLQIKTINDVDLRLQSFTTFGNPVTVPEPANLALLGLGFAAFGYSRRKTKA